MSAFIVSNKHIDALLNAALQYGRSELRWYWPDYPAGAGYERGVAISAASVAIAQETENTLTLENASKVGLMLLRENYRSVNHRYDENNMPNACRHTLGPALPPVHVLSLLAGFEYQSCEHSGWEKSEAKKFCDALQRRLIRALPGYDEAPWSI